MVKGNTRSDKKFEIKVWVKAHDKLIFRSHCFEYHLSMMYVGEKYLQTCLKEFPDKKLEEIIEQNLGTYINMKAQRDGYETIGIRMTNDYWQKMAYFAVRYKTHIAKIASCLFQYCLGAYELRGIEEEHGLTFTYNRKKRFEGKSFSNGRLSDY